MNDKKKKKLNEESILERLSNGEMYQVNGGKSDSSTNVEVLPSLDNCLAGCGCSPHRACNTAKLLFNSLNIQPHGICYDGHVAELSKSLELFILRLRGQFCVFWHYRGQKTCFSLCGKKTGLGSLLSCRL